MIKNKQIKVVFLVDQFVFTDIESAKKSHFDLGTFYDFSKK